MLERDLARFAAADAAATPSPLGSGALAGSTLPLPRAGRRADAELARRRRGPRLRARLPLRVHRAVHAPVADRRGARPLGDERVRLREAAGGRGDGLVDDAAQAEPGRRRARPRQGGDDDRPAHRAARRREGPAARVRPRPAGGQAAGVRRAARRAARARRARRARRRPRARPRAPRRGVRRSAPARDGRGRAARRRRRARSAMRTSRSPRRCAPGRSSRRRSRRRASRPGPPRSPTRSRQHGRACGCREHRRRREFRRSLVTCPSRWQPPAMSRTDVADRAAPSVRSRARCRRRSGSARLSSRGTCRRRARRQRARRRRT